jgi:hypothetical protein
VASAVLDAATEGVIPSGAAGLDGSEAERETGAGEGEQPLAAPNTITSAAAALLVALIET